jgi:hypothetical protein
MQDCRAVSVAFVVRGMCAPSAVPQQWLSVKYSIFPALHRLAVRTRRGMGSSPGDGKPMSRSRVG